MDGVNILELAIQRACSGFFNRGLIHAARVKVAYFLPLAAFGGEGARRGVENFEQIFLVSGLKLVERAPAWIGSRDGVLGQPPAVGKMIEVHASVDTFVEVGEVESR